MSGENFATTKLRFFVKCFAGLVKKIPVYSIKGIKHASFGNYIFMQF